jgi:hypothetical protein
VRSNHLCKVHFLLRKPHHNRVITIIDRLHCFDQLRALVFIKEPGRLGDQSPGDFSLNHPNRARADVVALPPDKSYNVIIEVLFIFICDCCPGGVPFFFGFISPVFRLVLGNDVYTKLIGDRPKNTLRRIASAPSERGYKTLLVRVDEQEVPAICKASIIGTLTFALLFVNTNFLQSPIEEVSQVDRGERNLIGGHDLLLDFLVG